MCPLKLKLVYSFKSLNQTIIIYVNLYILMLHHRFRSCFAKVRIKEINCVRVKMYAQTFQCTLQPRQQKDINYNRLKMQQDINRQI